MAEPRAATALIAEDEPLLAQALSSAPRREQPALEVLATVGDGVQARCIRTAVRDKSGKIHLSLRGRPKKLTASRLYAHLFKAF